MADNVSTILDVKLDAGKVAQDLQDLVTRIAALKAQQKDLNQQIKEGNDIDGKYAEQLIRVKDQLAWTEKQAKGLSATTKLLNADTLTYSDSLNGERQKLADMQKAYDQLDKAQRESEGGKAFLASIQAQSDAVKQMEADTGRAQRNVGNYTKSLLDAIPIGGKFGNMLKNTASNALAGEGGFKAFTGGIKQATAASLKFIATPLGLILAAIALAVAAVKKAFDKVTEAFKKNDEAMTAVTKAFAIFKPIGEAINAIFDSIATALAKVATAMADAVNWIVGKLAPAYAEEAKEAQAFVQAQDDLEEAERQYTVNSAKRNSEVAELRAKAVESEKYSTAERRKMIEQAIELDKQNLEEQKRITAEKLRLLEIEAKQNKDTSDEMKNRIAEARAAMYQAEENYYSGERRLNSQLTSFDKEEQQKRTENTKKALAKREQAKKEAAEREKEQIKNTQEIQQMAEDFALSLIKDETTKKIAQYKIQGVREIEALKERLKTEKNLTEEARAQLEQLIKDKTRKLNDDLAEMAAEAVEQQTEAELQAERERAQRILELKLELAQEGSEAELELQKELLDMQMQQALEELGLSEEEQLLIKEYYKQQKEQLDKDYYDNLKKTGEDAKNAYIGGMIKIAKNAATIFGNLSDLIGEVAGENENAAAAQKAFAMTSIITNQAASIAEGALALAEGIRTATAIGFPQNIPAIISITAMIGSMIAGITSTIKQAKDVFKQADAGNYATGGVVGGTSYTGDRLVAHVNSGEGIYTGTQANNLLQEIANNPLRIGWDMETFGETVAAAVAAQPAPVVVYSELQEFGQKVTTYDEIASI